MESISTHNGEITMQNPATGQHRTIRIRTQKPDAKFAPGARIASLLNGHNNETDYLPFAFVKPSGRVIVWKRYRGEYRDPSSYEKLARMIQDPARFEEQGVVYMFSTACRLCNRKLTRPESIRSGIGSTCAGRE